MGISMFHLISLFLGAVFVMWYPHPQMVQKPPISQNIDAQAPIGEPIIAPKVETDKSLTKDTNIVIK